MSDIRVFVSFPKSATGGAIFAGETLECTITFKNVSPVPGGRPAMGLPQPQTYTQSHLQVQNQHQQQQHQQQQAQRALPQSQGIKKSIPRMSVVSPRVPQGPQTMTMPGHKPRLSLSVPAEGKSATTTTGGVTSPNGATSPITNRQGKPHQRSISIVSLSSDIGGGGGNGGGGAGGDDHQPHQRGGSLSMGPGPPQSRGNARRGAHSRSASLQQFSPRPSALSPGMASTAFAKSPPIPATPMIVESGDAMTKFSFPAKVGGTPATPQIHWGAGGALVGSGRGTIKHAQSESINTTFKFPSSTGGEEMRPQVSQESNGNGGKVTNIDLRSPGGSDEESVVGSASGQHKQILGLGINGDTPRSSGEFYSLANSTTETLVSEYDPRLGTNRLIRPQHGRRHSLLAVGTRPPEILMMGYAQVMGTFTLDGSLVHTSPFEEIKKRGVVGGQGGGGVVGIETHKSEGKLFSSFGWGGFGGAIGGLLGGNNMSSMAEMKTLANTKNIPILSTPQSILFVDLRLAPGESRSYEFKFPLPKGLPPSHRGKAIKVSYMLKIGTQRAGKGVQQPKVVEIPFRVFPHVDANGSFRRHDLMQPIILLRDEAAVSCVEEQQQNNAQTPAKGQSQSQTKQESMDSSLAGFLSYVDSLIAPHSTSSKGGLASPSPSFRSSSHNSMPSTPVPRGFDTSPQPVATSRDNIEMAILRGGGGGDGAEGRGRNGQMPAEHRCSIFEIARNGHRVASLTLARPAYKLGDTITAVIDFSGAAIPCYHIHATLESSESVSPQLALRSPSSIHRTTRKIHASHSEACLFAQRVQFTPTIPPSASPEFTTSCVALTWRLNIEFITPALLGRSGAAAELGEEELLIDGLLEKAEDGGKRGRGEIWEARQGVLVESFDAHIPVRVYPNVKGCDAGQGVVGGWGFGGGFGGVAEEGYVV